MTNELEKTFFNTFGIEPKNISTGECKYKITPEFCESDCLDCKNTIKGKTYPQITDRILLELICIHNTYLEANLYSLDYDSLKKEILKDLINEQESREFKKDYISDDMEHQVRTLFEEG